HLFEAETIRKLLDAKVPEDGLVLACDYNRNNPLVDPEDVTRVRVESSSGCIRDIGKALTDYNAWDTGLFLCTPAFLSELEQAAKEGDSSLSAGVRRLAARDRALALDVTGAF
ncbi:hypothetical protein, partial [Priestia megaterium]|uniref:hypothetical protein n=1 Tax=Priestia megaterium TaxID=1404 RepID=UPI0035B69588